MRPSLGKALYACLFVLVLPVALVLWAAAATPNVPLPAIHSALIGWALIACGASLMAWGAVSLMLYGGGLPMNAYPPPRFVSRGAYGVMAHPMYCGFGAVCVGAAIAAGSASGLWLVAPTTILGATALVLGHERIDLGIRFPGELPRPFLALPADAEGAPSAAERAAIYILVLVPSLLFWVLLGELGVSFDGRVLGGPRFVDGAAWVFIGSGPLIASSRRDLRELGLEVGMAALLMPLLLAALSARAFPAYGLLWFLLTLVVFARRWSRARVGWWALGAAASLMAAQTKAEGIVPVVGAALLFTALIERQAIWEAVRRAAETVAGSWKEWQWGPFRIIDHGLYAGLGGFVGLFIVGSLLGPPAYLPMILVGVTLQVASALWAQLVEGSPSLLRPYGFYGALLGGIVACLASGPLFGIDPWLLLGAFAVAAPWTQAIGRFRCLVQGCCHGREAPAWVGIVYRHPRSRVCRLSKLGGIPVHPTPLYSTLCNAAIMLFVTRLWFERAPLSLIAGVYLVLNGLGRFVEEAYRGEPQTRLVRGLRFYQWIAIVSVVGGAVLTALPSNPAPAGLNVDPLLLVFSALMGLLSWFALGVDFPGLNRRFARLV